MSDETVICRRRLACASAPPARQPHGTLLRDLRGGGDGIAGEESGAGGDGALSESAVAHVETNLSVFQIQHLLFFDECDREIGAAKLAKTAADAVLHARGHGLGAEMRMIKNRFGAEVRADAAALAPLLIDSDLFHDSCLSDSLGGPSFNKV